MNYRNSTNRKVGVYFSLFLLLASSSCSSTRIGRSMGGKDYSKLKPDSLVMTFDTAGNHLTNIAAETDLVVLSFFSHFNDTIKLYHDNAIRWQSFVPNFGSDIVGSESTAVDVAVHMDKPNVLIKLQLWKRKNYVSLILDKDFPFCSVHYNNRIWYVACSKKQITIK